MNPDVLAVDLGTTGVKVAVVDPDGSVRGSAGETFPMLYTDDGGVEQDAENWWDALGRCSRRAQDGAGTSGSGIGAVAVTSQYMSIVPVTADGRPLMNAIMWMDGRGRRHHDLLHDPEAAGLWIEVHGLPPLPNDDLAHVAFVRNERPEVYEQAAAFVEPVDYLLARLSGRVTGTQNTVFGLLSVDNRTHGATEYSDVLLARSRMDVAKLPPLVPFGEVLGKVTSSAADHLGITSEAIVLSGTIDSITSAVGSGAIDNTTCSLVVGTTSVIVTHVGDKRHDLAHGLTTVPSPLPGKYFVMAENGVGGKALDFFVNNLVFDDDGLSAAIPEDAFERVLAVAATAPAGANGVVFLPWLVGSMAPGMNRDVRGGFVNVSLTTRRADLARAVLEGVALNAGWLFPHVAALADAHYDTLNLGGGGAVSPLWGQVIADALGVRVRRLAQPRTTNAQGAALLALAQLGRIGLDDIPALLRVEEVHEPSAAAHAVYQRLSPAFVDFHDRAAPFFHTLNSREAAP
jgi:xylulokinase